KNRTLIEAARTMLADSLLPIPFWAEAINTVCYVQNRVLVTKPHNKTPYELLHGSGPIWLFDIDSLTRTMNYQPVTAGNQTNSSASFQDKFDAEKVGEEINQQYVLFPVWSSGSTNRQCFFKTKLMLIDDINTQSMFDETLATNNAKWESFSNQVKLYGHNRHAKVAKLIPKVPKLKWKTKGNFQDCGIFTMLHMDCFNGGAIANWDCGLFGTSRLQFDMLRRLRFKFAIKMLLHEINVHAQKMLDLAKEFDKLDSYVKMSIIVDTLKNKKERDCI
nr:hypothetical protein [Tanacetum cinerariifolium]